MEHSTRTLIPEIVTYRPGTSYSQPVLFIQTKGDHSGRPLLEPIANCAAMILDTQQDVQYWYWMCFGLWKACTFRRLLRGSVVPFITLGDIKKTLQAAQLEHGGPLFTKKALQLEKLHQLELHYQQMIEKIKLMQVCTLRVDSYQ